MIKYNLPINYCIDLLTKKYEKRLSIFEEDKISLVKVQGYTPCTAKWHSMHFTKEILEKTVGCQFLLVKEINSIQYHPHRVCNNKTNFNFLLIHKGFKHFQQEIFKNNNSQNVILLAGLMRTRSFYWHPKWFNLKCVCLFWLNTRLNMK